MEPNYALIAGLIGDATRARMLSALMAGKALTAMELAVEADITAQTASSHLAKLVDAQLLIARKQGRHRYFQLHRPEVAELIEKLFNVAATSNILTGPVDQRLRSARICYDHLAGSIGVALYDSLTIQNYLVDDGEETHLNEKGRLFFENVGVNFDEFDRSKRPTCKSCLDWSERRNHLAGKLGHWVLDDIFAKKWAHRESGSRLVHFTTQGLQQFKKTYQLP